ncbi:hypothetical protein ACQP2Y_20955 [Actinoplanes sp. CA-051413]|uniref:hypothetical protein n=1 Tax=Actinoplanes sp. CA-051413 TaxID=3239899 RepID=UPI003D95B7E6
MGEPCGPREETNTDWAIVVDCLANGAPGPHLIPCEQGETHARRRLSWWLDRHPEANPQLVKQEVTTRYDVWMVASDQRPEPTGDRT